MAALPLLPPGESRCHRCPRPALVCLACCGSRFAVQPLPLRFPASPGGPVCGSRGGRRTWRAAGGLGLLGLPCVSRAGRPGATGFWGALGGRGCWAGWAPRSSLPCLFLPLIWGCAPRGTERFRAFGGDLWRYSGAPRSCELGITGAGDGALFPAGPGSALGSASLSCLPARPCRREGRSRSAALHPARPRGG